MALRCRSYWQQAETNMIDAMKCALEKAAEADRDTAEEFLTDYCTKVQEQAFTDAKSLLNDVLWYQSENSNTMKYGLNPETHEVLDSPRVIDPMTVELDASIYAQIPGAEG